MMKQLRALEAVGVMATMFLLGSCGEDDSNAGASGVDSTKLMAALSDAETKKFCDWAAGARTVQICSNNFPIQPERSEICVGDIEGLPETCLESVAAREACVVADQCDNAALNAACGDKYACTGQRPAAVPPNPAPAAPTPGGGTGAVPGMPEVTPVAPADPVAPPVDPVVPPAGGGGGAGGI
jgi:hypothetical protein